MTSDELRIAARQAITMALSMKEEADRDDLLVRAQRLLEEACGAPPATVRQP